MFITNLLVASSSQGISYSITPDITLVDEGSTVTFTVVTTGLTNGTVLYWTNDGTSSAADFTDNKNSDSFTVVNGLDAITATIARPVSSDLITEGPETIIMNLRTGSTSGTIVATATTVTINDTSINPNFTVDYLVVGGGGSGGGWGSGWSSGGGGAGGLLQGSFTATAGHSYSIGVGSGAAGGAGFNTGGNQGGGSSLSGPALSITAYGGGGGQMFNNSGRIDGGSGGGILGATTNGTANTAGKGTAGQGNNGSVGVGNVGTQTGNGGGGGGSGGPGSTNGAGGGGTVSYIGGGYYVYASGGSGVKGGTKYAGGAYGDGGGGGYNSGSTVTGKAGANGVVILRYPDSISLAASSSVSGIDNGGYWIYIFTGSGSITF
jgi:hypothetical protein